jgi:hypothetical protein
VTGRGWLVQNSDDADKPMDLTILLDAMAAVVGEVSKTYQAVKRAADSGDPRHAAAAQRAFDDLPAWQREKILAVATEQAAARVPR